MSKKLKKKMTDNMRREVKEGGRLEREGGKEGGREGGRVHVQFGLLGRDVEVGVAERPPALGDVRLGREGGREGGRNSVRNQPY